MIGRGETLTSISKQYSVSISAIAAANRSIVDIDLVFKGQHLNIPSASGDAQMVSKAAESLVIWSDWLLLWLKFWTFCVIYLFDTKYYPIISFPFACPSDKGGCLQFSECHVATPNYIMFLLHFIALSEFTKTVIMCGH